MEFLVKVAPTMMVIKFWEICLKELSNEKYKIVYTIQALEVTFYKYLNAYYVKMDGIKQKNLS